LDYDLLGGMVCVRLSGQPHGNSGGFIPGMRFWWVNQNQTWRQEITGGYLWSPQHKSNGQINMSAQVICRSHRQEGRKHE